MPAQEGQPQISAGAESASVPDATQPLDVAATVPAEHVTTGNYINRMPPPTDAQVEEAAKHGFDLTKQEKYYSPEAWAARNK